MDVREWTNGELGQLARKAYKAAQPLVGRLVVIAMCDV
jgi:hypothetical protein